MSEVANPADCQRQLKTSTPAATATAHCPSSHGIW